MPNQVTALVLRRTSWQLVAMGNERAERVDSGEWNVAETIEVAEAIAGALASHDVPSTDIALLLDSNLALAARFSIESPRQLRRPDAMLFELEEWLPVAAEDLSATYVRDGLNVLAVAAARPDIQQLAEALEDQGVDIDLVTPLVTLAVASHIEQDRRNEPYAVLWLRQDGSGDLVQISSARLASWQFLPNAQRNLVREWQYESLRGAAEIPIHIYHSGKLPSALLNELTHVDMVETTVCDGDPLVEPALEALQAIRSGIQEPVAALPQITATSRFQQPLAKEVRLVLGTLVLLLGSLAFVNWRAAQQSTSSSQQAQIAAEDVFREVLPGARLRTGVRSRLESELAKLAGVRGSASESELAGSALPLLYDLLVSLPEEMRFRLLEIRVEEDELHVTGEVRSFADADRIAGALRGRGLQVTPPTTQRLPTEGVSFRLVAEKELSDSTANGEKHASGS